MENIENMSVFVRVNNVWELSSCLRDFDDIGVFYQPKDSILPELYFKVEKQDRRKHVLCAQKINDDQSLIIVDCLPRLIDTKIVENMISQLH